MNTVLHESNTNLADTVARPIETPYFTRTNLSTGRRVNEPIPFSFLTADR